MSAKLRSFLGKRKTSLMVPKPHDLRTKSERLSIEIPGTAKVDKTARKKLRRKAAICERC